MHGRLRDGWADEVPVGVQRSNGTLEELTLIPYGCADMRATGLPRLLE